MYSIYVSHPLLFLRLSFSHLVLVNALSSILLQSFRPRPPTRGSVNMCMTLVFFVFFIWSLFRFVCCNLSISRLFTRPVLVCVLCCCSNSPRQSRQQKRGSLGKRTSIPPIVLLKCLNGRPLSGNYTPSPHFTCLVLFCFFAQHTL